MTIRKTLLVTTISMLALPSLAAAGGIENSLGVGVDLQLNGLLGPSVNYDTGKFHAGGLLAFEDGGDDNDTTIGLGGRFFYHLASTASSDFSVGGQFGFISRPDNNPLTDDNINEFHLEPGFQIRAFVVPNVAVSLTAALRIGLGDANGVTLTGTPVAGAGVHYYFD